MVCKPILFQSSSFLFLLGLRRPMLPMYIFYTNPSTSFNNRKSQRTVEEEEEQERDAVK
jgi:hypothetical protein